METIRVNMTPCEDVQTIHASQNDNEAREWGFELHNNGDVIDSSEITDQMVFKAYKGGTEEILPTNGSTPTTSPFKGDIKYPQGLLSGQEFLYRESPTEEDGLAWIKNIKGNTLVWNQLVKNGNFADTSNWSSSSNVSITASNNILQVTNAVGRDGDYYSAQNIPMKVGHKYYFHAEAKKTDVSTAQTLLLVFFGEGSNMFAIDAIKENTNWVSKSTIFTCASNTYNFVRLRTQVANATDEFRNVVLIDLTQMGLDISSPSEFTSLFPLSYYAYNQGTLLSFMGNGIKTVGKNLLSYSGENLPYNANGVSITREDNIYKVVASNPSGYPFARISTISYLPKGQYTVTMLGAETSSTGIAWRLIDRNVSPVKIFVNASATTTTFTLNEDLHDVYFEITIDASKLSAGAWDVRFQLNMGTPSDYEPYTSSTTDLPISTYFPQGMKSVGDVYDELTEAKAITRVGSRAYQSGDESDTSVITDGTTTYYALATPTETSFTTASLVTENAEIPLSAENDVLIGKCTEELSAEPGFHDAKIKLTDSDGTCYSNKIQLHVERSPQ